MAAGLRPTSHPHSGTPKTKKTRVCQNGAQVQSIPSRPTPTTADRNPDLPLPSLVVAGRQIVRGHLRARRPPTAARNVAHPGAGRWRGAGRRVLSPFQFASRFLLAVDGTRTRAEQGPGREVDADPLARMSARHSTTQERRGSRFVVFTWMDGSRRRRWARERERE